MSGIAQLHKAIAQVAPIHGVASQSAGGYRIDFKDEATEQQRTDAEAIAANFTPTPDPSWLGLLAGFTIPGNALYESVLAKTGFTGLAYHRFMNLQSLILNAPTNPDLQNQGALAIAITNLYTSLADAGNPLDSENITDWNDLMTANDFSDSCKLPTE